jgi:hypothetical protein
MITFLSCPKFYLHVKRNGKFSLKLFIIITVLLNFASGKSVIVGKMRSNGNDSPFKSHKQPKKAKNNIRALKKHLERCEWRPKLVQKQAQLTQKRSSVNPIQTVAHSARQYLHISASTGGRINGPAAPLWKRRPH